MPDDFHRAQVDSAPETIEMVSVETVPSIEMPDSQAAHGIAGDGRLRAHKFNGGALKLLLF